jgi:hypothetical protein
MKNQLMLSLAAMLVTATVFGQENDDMYFNSKDRAKLKAQATSEAAAYTASAKKPKKIEQAADEVINPTDSYSARNVNPEFAARSNSQTAAADNQDYFVNNYQYNTSSNLNKWNSNYNNWAGSPWYAANYYSPSINEWGSPYYGSSYDPYGNPWCNPYYRSSYSSSFSYYMGSSWNYGWGSGIGMGMSYAYGNPYMNSWGYPGYGYGGYGYGGGYGYYPSTVVIVNNGGDNGRNVVYGKRASHGGMVTVPRDASYTRTRTNYANSLTPVDAGGRVSTTPTSGRTQRQEDYYNRAWRGSQQTQSSNPSRSSSKDSWNNWNNNPNSSWNNNSTRSSYDSPSGSGGGGATRQSAPASSGSNGRTRGRD